MDNRPYAPACERNKAPILEVLREVFSDTEKVLEIGSGTGQHAVFFAKNLPHLQWQTSDLEENHEGIKAWIEEANLPNILPPLKLDVSNPDWPISDIDAVFTANTLHIMGWDSVKAFFQRLQEILPSQGIFCVYGPFCYNGKHTSPSNAQFDEMLRSRDPKSGIRDFAELEKLAQQAGLCLVEDYAMPANNRILYWRKN